MIAAVNQLTAQNNRDVYDWPVPESVVTLEIYCDGLLVDVLQNTMDYTLKCRDKYKDGEWVAWNQHLNNISFVSLWTEELFILQGHETGTWNPTVGIGEFRSNFIGNKGNKYIVSVTYELDPITWLLTPIDIKSVCH